MKEIKAYQGMDGSIYKTEKDARWADRCYLRECIRDIARDLEEDQVQAVYQFLVAIKNK